MEGKAIEIEKVIEFANTEIEELKRKGRVNEDKIKKKKINFCTKKGTIEERACVSSEFWKPPTVLRIQLVVHHFFQIRAGA